MDAALEQRLRRLLDKDEIETVLHRWATAVGRCDWERVRCAFHDNALDLHGTFDGNIDEFVDWQQRHHDGIEQSVHFLGPIDVEFAGPDLALVETYVTVYQRFSKDAAQPRIDVLGSAESLSGKPLMAEMVGRYIDQFERHAGAWKIATRQVVFEWLKIDDADVEIPRQDGWTLAKRDRTDVIYEIRDRLGLP